VDTPGAVTLSRWQQRCKHIVDSNPFQLSIIVAILLGGIIAGVETYELETSSRTALWVIDLVVILFFVIEVVLKIGSSSASSYFQRRSNVFDFVVTVCSFVGVLGVLVSPSTSLVPQLLRLLRILELISHSHTMQVVVGGLLHGVMTGLYIMVLCTFLIFLYTWMGTFYFANNDPVNFGTSARTIFTLTKILTLDDWVQIMYVNMLGCDWASAHAVAQIVEQYDSQECTQPEALPLITGVYFCSYIVFMAWILVSLFTGSILTSMEHVVEQMREQSELEDNIRQRQNVKHVMEMSMARLHKMSSHGRSHATLRTTKQSMFAVPSHRKLDERRHVLAVQRQRSTSTTSRPKRQAMLQKASVKTTQELTVQDFARLPQDARKRIHKRGKLERAFGHFVDAEERRRKKNVLRGKLPHPFFEESYGGGDDGGELWAATLRGRQQLYKVSEHLTYDEGDVLIREDGMASTMLFIVRGTVDVIAQGKMVTTIGPGISGRPKVADYIGEFAILSGTTIASATCKAATMTQVLAVSRKNFEHVLRQYPNIADAFNLGGELDDRRSQLKLQKEHTRQEKSYLARQFSTILTSLDIVARLKTKNPHLQLTRIEDPTLEERLSDLYATVCLTCDELRSCDSFKGTISLLLVVGSVATAVLLGVFRKDPDDVDIIRLNYAAVICLATDVCIHLLAEGYTVKRFLYHRWNICSVLLLCASAVSLSKQLSSEVRGNMVLLLSMLRILYIAPLANRLPFVQQATKVRELGAGLRGSFSSLGCIASLLLLLFYLYAVIGVLFLGANDPFFFGTLHWAVLTLFIVCSLDKWFEIMLISRDGCDQHSYPLYRSVAEAQAAAAGHQNATQLCSSPHAHGHLVMLYFSSFIFLSAYVMLTLFVGVVTQAIHTQRKRSEYKREKAKDIKEIQDQYQIHDKDLTKYSEAYDVISEVGRYPVSGLRSQCSTLCNLLSVISCASSSYPDLVHRSRHRLPGAACGYALHG
jgi:voltage-gated sodium channel